MTSNVTDTTLKWDVQSKEENILWFGSQERKGIKFPSRSGGTMSHFTGSCIT